MRNPTSAGIFYPPTKEELLAELNFKKLVKKVTFYNLDEKKIIDFNVENIKKEEIKNKILEKIEKIENTKEFLPKMSGLCTHCDFFEICPANKELVFW